MCNIFDLSGNSREWTTETFNTNNYKFPCVIRGGSYHSSWYTSKRNATEKENAFDGVAFRAILYLK